MSAEEAKTQRSYAPPWQPPTNTGWIKTQQEVFASWLNIHLRDATPPLPQVTNISKDLSDGVVLCTVLQKIRKKGVIKFKNPPHNRHERISNVGTVLSILHEDSVRLVNIGAEDIVDSRNVALVMGLIWAMIQKYQGISERDQLLAWVNSMIKQDGLAIQSFTEAQWKQGLPLVSLVRSIDPDGPLQVGVSWKEIEANPSQYVGLALETAEKRLGVPRLLKPEHLGNIDEDSVRTYLSYFPKQPVRRPIEHPEPKEDPMVEEMLARLEEKLRGAIVSELEKSKSTGDATAEKILLEVRATQTPSAAAKNVEGRLNRLNRYVDLSKTRFDTLHVTIEQKGNLLITFRREVAEEIKKAAEEIASLIQDISRLSADLKESKAAYEAAKQEIATLRIRVKVAEESRVKETRDPPSGHVTLVFTDVQGSTTQWEKNANIMARAIQVHNVMFRRLIEEHNGYEVKTEGDAFMIAFSSVKDALELCLHAQHELMNQDWGEDLLKNEESREEYTANRELLWKGLRVRMGVHVGEPSCQRDPVTTRMDYFGPMVNRSARVESVANGGQIIMSKQAWDEVNSLWGKQLNGKDVEMTPMGKYRLKGLSEDMELLQVLPIKLKDRAKAWEKKKETQELGEPLAKPKIDDRLVALEKQNNALIAALKMMTDQAEKAQDKAAKLQEKIENMAELLAESEMGKFQFLMHQMKSLMDQQTSLSGKLSEARGGLEQVRNGIREFSDQKPVTTVDVEEQRQRDRKIAQLEKERDALMSTCEAMRKEKKEREAERRKERKEFKLKQEELEQEREKLRQEKEMFEKKCAEFVHRMK